MAVGDFKWFAQALHDVGNATHNLSGDDLRMGFVTNALPPSINMNGPHWGGAGATNLANNQVATGTAYDGPIVLTAIAWTKTTTGGLLDFADIAIDQDASGFANGAYGVVYNNTDINKRAIGFVELSAAGVLSNIEKKVELTINASGALSITQQ